MTSKVWRGVLSAAFVAAITITSVGTPSAVAAGQESTGASDAGHTITLYAAACPPDYAGDASADECDADPVAGVPFRVGRPFSEAFTDYVTTGDDGQVVLRFDGLPANGALRVIGSLPIGTARFVAYCLDDAGTPLEVSYPGDVGNPHLGVADVAVGSASDVLCDWYLVPQPHPTSGEERETAPVEDEVGEGRGTAEDPTITPGAAPTVTAERSVARCERVELYPGYLGYRGYVTGLDGVGDQACLADLEAADPGFDRASEDAENQAAASRIGLAGVPGMWTWENWMAVEAERGLPPTCYSCAIFSAAEREGAPGDPGDPGDPRLLVGGHRTTRALAWVAGELGVPVATVTAVLPDDHALRALVGLLNPGRHFNAAELLATYPAVVEDLVAPGLYLDPEPLKRALLDQGGYAPTSAAAADDDQVFMVVVGLDLLLPYYDAWSQELTRSQFLGAADSWRLARSRDPASTSSFAEWLRTTGALG